MLLQLIHAVQSLYTQAQYLEMTVIIPPPPQILNNQFAWYYVLYHPDPELSIDEQQFGNGKAYVKHLQGTNCTEDTDLMWVLFV
jgi:hypothetical protein